VGKNQFTITPYPFRRELLEIAIVARRIPKRRYTDDVDLQRVLTAASFFQMKYTVRAGAKKDRALGTGS
jgi:hypothetical protein